jgi:hypothetical protein
MRTVRTTTAIIDGVESAATATAQRVSAESS